jgi:hypothetical protein
MNENTNEEKVICEECGSPWIVEGYCELCGASN